MAGFQELARYLQNLGLGSLFSLNADGTPSGWLYEQMVNGVDNENALAMAIEATPEFKQRYGIIDEMRQRAVRGENVTVPTVEQVKAYEDQYRTVMSAYNVPSWFYDSYDDAHNAIRKNLTVQQIEERVQISYDLVQKMPKEVKDVFAEFYGDMGTDQGLLAAVLDPEKTTRELGRATRASYFGGLARRQQEFVTKQQAEIYADLNRTPERAMQDVQQMAEIRPITETQMGESNINTSGDLAFQAGALQNAAALREVESRLTTRKLGQQSTFGGASGVQSGLTGSGKAQ
jgi:hypothetical protein